MSENENRALRLIAEAEELAGPYASGSAQTAAAAAAALATAYLTAELLEVARSTAASLERLAFPPMATLEVAEAVPAIDAHLPELPAEPEPEPVQPAARKAPVKRAPAKRSQSRR